jgi:hypothetical protein
VACMYYTCQRTLGRVGEKGGEEGIESVFSFNSNVPNCTTTILSKLS